MVRREMAPAPHPKHLYLVDGSGYIFRAFHALPPMTRADGTPVNAVLGFVTMLMRLLADTDADALAVIFDAGRRSFRHDIYPDYKANRPEAPEELVPQFGLVREATRAFNVPAIEQQGFEADDLIASYARQAAAAGIEVTVVSSDKDLMQLVGPRIRMLDPIKNRPIGEAEVKEKFGVGPDKVVDVQSLAGDSTDNLPGVPGIGVKTAAELINQFGDLDTLLARAGEIKQPKRRQTLLDNADAARLTRQLVRLRDDLPLPCPLESLGRREPDRATLVAFLNENQFRGVLARIEGRGATAAPAPAAKGEVLPAASAPAAATPAAPTKVAYELVQDLERLAAWIEEARSLGTVAFDTETTGLDPLVDELVGFSLATAPGRACYVPLQHRRPGADGFDFSDGSVPVQVPLKPALALLKSLLEDQAVLKIGQNIKFDMAVMAGVDIAIRPHDDTMLLSYVLEGALHSHGMDQIAETYLNYKTIKFADVAGSGKARVTFDRVALDQARDYAAEDADVTLRLHRVLKPRLLAERQVSLYETLERPLVPVIVAMERTGMKVDARALAALSSDFGQRMVALEAEIHRLAGRPFNVGSPKQLGEVMFDELRLGQGKKGRTGAYTTDADVLEELAAQGHALPARVLDWRQIAKLKSTYADALAAQINPRTGRVHTSFALAATSTGRLASSDPNLQNIPIRTEEGRKIRRAFIAEPDHLLLSVDYSQIELRLAAHCADETALKEAFRRGDDIHAITASGVFGVPVEGMDPSIRRRAKAINFGIIYGISPFGLAQQLGIGQAEARAYIEAYFARYPGIRDYMERTRKLAREQGFVTTLFGRRCHAPGIKDANPARRGFAERAAINAPLQGTAADIVKRAMIRVVPALAAAGLKARMLLQVHDELLFEVPKDEAAATAALVKSVMERATQPALELSVPLVADIGLADNWADAH